jgi:Protein of unknown function (DUF1769)
MSSGAPSSATSSPPNESSSPTTREEHAEKYKLRVLAGTSYDPSTLKVVPVNSPETTHLDSEHMLLSLVVRIKTFTGYPTSSPTTSSYFEHPLHTWDQYSISFSFIPKVDINGNDLVFGNDFDRPIRDRLPPGFGQALRIAKWIVDPGLDGDPYADKPYLYGPALSSWNVLRIGEKFFDPEKQKPDGDAKSHKGETEKKRSEDSEAWKMPNAEAFHETVVEEGAEGSGEEVRSSLSIPSDSAGRKKHFLTESYRENFTFEAGRLYQSDFGNPYLDFNDFSLKLPGFSLKVVQYLDEGHHELRYVLKNKSTDEVYAVVLFSLVFGDERDAEAQKQLPGLGEDTGSEYGDAKEALYKNDEKKQNGDFGNEPEPGEDDVD